MNYKIVGEPLPAVICDLNPGETLITESGAMSWMTPNMKMETSTGGGIGKALGRMFSGDTIFQNRYTAQGGSGQIAFASSFPGSIRAFNIEPGKEIVVQKSSFLASEDSVDLSIFFQKKLGSGFFGGEGFILQKLSGTGMVFLEVDGDAVEKTLAPGEVLYVDTGNVVAFENTVEFEAEMVKGLGNIFFGGEGLFLTKLTGPGKIILQTLNFGDFAGRIISRMPSNNG